ncbi:MAG: oxygenase MpaB family protein [Bacteroidota bacterium]
MGTIIKPTRIFSHHRMQAMRQEADPIADEVIEAVYQERGMVGIGQLMTFLSKKQNQSNYITPQQPIAKDYAGINMSKTAHEQWVKAAIATASLAFTELPGAELPVSVHNFFASYQQLPAWSNVRQMAEGSIFFQKYTDPLMLLLGLYSLPYCYAAADGAQVIYMSQRIHKDTYNRLLETAQFVLEVTKPDAFSANGAGFITCNKIRLMHATIRFYSKQSGRWNDAWGLPINQDDMASTNLAMSYIPIRGLRKLNLNPEDKESEAYLHLWNVVGYLLGVKEELLPANLREAYHIDRVNVSRNFRSSDAGIVLTKALLDSLNYFAPESMPKKLPVAQMRLLLGDDVADMLAIPAADWTWNLVKTTQLRNFFQSLRIA